jgi:hypothetical protein
MFNDGEPLEPTRLPDIGEISPQSGNLAVLVAAARPASQPKPDANVLAEYTAILQDRAQLTAQRITMTTIYTTLNTAVLGGIAYVVLIAPPALVFGLDTRTLAALIALIPMLAVNYTWLQTVNTFGYRLGVNWYVLRDMEHKFAFEGRLVTNQYKTSGSPSVLEQRLALIFLFAYPVGALAIATANSLTIALGH